jgi:anthranilate synthase/aminodeoxychorismate synthase-like glutamine amidotransferase
MIVVIDNYDSFTYNLVQYLSELGAEIQVFRNDKISVAEVLNLCPDHIVISPGPGTPDNAGISMELIKQAYREIPILGVCLGHQSIAQALGGQVIRAPRLMHGKTSPIHHDSQGIFAGLPNPFEATRYHSLIVAEPLPMGLIATAYSDQGELMALRHRDFPLFGVQFHPESILTTEGKRMLSNFLEQRAHVGGECCDPAGVN